MAGKSAGAVRIGSVALAIAVVIAAYGAFRVYGGAAPFGPEVAKLALWVLLPLAVVTIQHRRHSS